MFRYVSCWLSLRLANLKFPLKCTTVNSIQTTIPLYTHWRYELDISMCRRYLTYVQVSLDYGRFLVVCLRKRDGTDQICDLISVGNRFHLKIRSDDCHPMAAGIGNLFRFLTYFWWSFQNTNHLLTKSPPCLYLCFASHRPMYDQLLHTHNLTYLCIQFTYLVDLKASQRVLNVDVN